MPIVALLLGTLGFWVLYWFIRMGGLGHVRELRAQRKEAARQACMHEASRHGPLRVVDDPREAAMILMLVLARGDGETTSEQIAAVEGIARAQFEFEDDWIGRLTQARFMANHTKNFDQAADAFNELFQRCLTLDERRQLMAMLQQVAPERPSATQFTAVVTFKRQLGIASA
jgi:uncharacterized tellurite resistance protein B-like protein